MLFDRITFVDVNDVSALLGVLELKGVSSDGGGPDAANITQRRLLKYS